MKQHIIQVEDEEFLVVTEAVNDAVMDFKAYEVVGWENSDDPRAQLWRKGEVTSLVNPTTDPKDADHFLSGHLKWDGCANFAVGEDGNHHTCGRTGMKAFAALMLAIFELGKTEIQGWNEEVAN